MKQDLIKKWYNPELTDEQNVSLLKEHGISISKRTLITWRKNQGIAKQRGGDRKSIDFKNQSAISKVQNITDKSKCNFQSAKRGIITNQQVIYGRYEQHGFNGLHIKVSELLSLLH